MMRRFPTPILVALILGSSLAGASGRQGESKKPTLAEIAKKLGLEIVSDPTQVYPLKTPHATLRGKKPAEKDLMTYKELLAGELAKYPKSLIEKIGLKKIVLSEDLTFDDQKRAGIPDFDNNIFHLDVKSGNWNPVYQRSVIHHELFHIIDLKDDGLLYEDKEWSKLNPPDFKYGKGGKNARGDDQWELDDKLQGFLNKYSLSGVEEDKAEIYSHFIVHAGKVLERAKKDAILSKKVERMKALLKAFCPEMNDAWWKATIGK